MTAVAINLSNNEQFMAWVLYDGGNPLEVMPFDVLVSVAMCAVLRVWGNVSDAGADCGDGTESAILRYVQTPAQIDQIGGVPGLSEAMESVGWLKWSDDDSHAVFPGFLKHNTLKPTDIGAADRMRRWRANKKASQPDRNAGRNAAVTETVTQAQLDRNATRNCSSESESVSVSSFAQAKEPDVSPIPTPRADCAPMPTETAAQEFARLAAEADTAFGGDGDIPPEPNALMLAVGRYCDSVGIGNESTRYRIYQDCAAWAGPEAFGPQIVAEGLRWGIEHSKPWKVVASHIRSKAETSGWVDKKAKDKPAGRSKAVERFMAGGDA